jgi:hypothetical protein
MKDKNNIWKEIDELNAYYLNLGLKLVLIEVIGLMLVFVLFG